MNKKTIHSANLHASTTHAQAKADAVEGKISHPAQVPVMNPRQPDDDRFPNGMVESDLDFARRNPEWIRWCEQNAKLLAAAPELLEALEAMIELREINEAVKSGRGATMSALHRARSAIAKTRN